MQDIPSHLIEMSNAYENAYAEYSASMQEPAPTSVSDRVRLDIKREVLLAKAAKIDVAYKRALREFAENAVAS